MSKWEEQKFGDLYLIPSRNGLTRPSSVRGAGYKFINMGEIFAYNRIGNIETELVQLNEKEKKEMTLQKNDLLFARQSLVFTGAGKCSIMLDLEDVVSFESHIIRVRLNPEIANPMFYYYYFSLPYNSVKTIVQQCAQAGIRGSDLEKIKVPCPYIEIQNQIADILSAYDDLIEANNRRIELLEQVAQELYKEWFVRFRFPGYENAKFEDGIPEGWAIKRMNEFCYVTDGTHDTPKPVDVGVPLVTGRCISSGFVDFDAAYNISETDHIGIKKRSGLKSGDILFSNIGTVGNCCVVDYNREFSVKNVIIFKPETMRDTAYLYYWMTSSTMQEIFGTQTNGASQQFVGLTFMRRYKLLVPKDDILEAFAEKVSPIVEQKRLSHQKNLNLAAQRDMLLPRLMSGKLEV